MTLGGSHRGKFQGQKGGKPVEWYPERCGWLLYTRGLLIFCLGRATKKDLEYVDGMMRGWYDVELLYINIDH